MIGPKSKLDASQVLQYAFDETTGRLRTDVEVSVSGPPVAVTISHLDDSIRLGDGVNLITSTTIGPKVGYDTNIINTALPLPTGASTSANQVTTNTLLSSLDLKIVPDIGNELFVRTDEQKVTIIDRVNSNLTYEGRALPGSLESNAVWQIKRILKTGTTTTTIYADNGNYSQVWDNRNSIFTPGTVLNLYSTNFDGVNDYIDFGNIHSFTQAQAFSYSFWMNSNNFSAARYLLNKMDYTAPVTGFRMGHDTAGKITTQVRASSSSLGFVTFNTVLSPATWYHIVWTWNGGSNQNSQKLYVNGVLDTLLVPSAAVTGTGFSNPVSLQFGQTGNSFFFSGKMDEMSVYNKELSLAEVTEIYNLENPTDLDSLTTAGSLLSWWRMGDGDTFPIILDQKGVGNGTMTNMIAGNFIADVP